MTYFQEIEDLKEFVGGAVNSSLRIESIAPQVLTARRKYLDMYVPPALADLAATTVTDLKEVAFAKLYKEALANFACYEYTFVGGTQLSDMGESRVETDSHKTAYKYQIVEKREKMRDDGYSALESCIAYLHLHRNDFVDYKDSEEESYAFERIIALSSDFRRAYSHNITRFVFESLLPVTEDVEEFAIIPIIGQALYEEQMTVITDTDPLRGKKLQVKKLLRRIVANFAVTEGIQRNVVQLRADSVVITEQLGEQGTRKQSVPQNNKLSLTLNQAELTANRYVSALTRYLAENVADFPSYKTHLDALAEAEKAEAEANETEDYDRCYPCLCRGRCSCADYDFHGSRGHTGGVVRL